MPGGLQCENLLLHEFHAVDYENEIKDLMKYKRLVNLLITKNIEKCSKEQDMEWFLFLKECAKELWKNKVK